MSELQDYVVKHTNRGECRCGQCLDAVVGPESKPAAHTVDMIFFKVSRAGEPTLEEFRKLTDSHHGVFWTCDPLDGNEHNYMELGGWIGDQGLAMQYMALGVLLGAFTLLSPALLGIPEAMAIQMAGAGMLSIIATKTATGERDHATTTAISD